MISEDRDIAEPKTVVPTRLISRIWLLPPGNGSILSTARNVIKSMINVIKDVPETGVVPTSPETLTAIAPRTNVRLTRRIAYKKEATTGYPEATKMKKMKIAAMLTIIDMC